MARGLNQASIIGNVGSIEINESKSGNVARISIATSEKWKDKTSGEDKELTEWHRVVIFGKLADVAKAYVKKGSKLFVQGKLRTTKYTDKEGIERYSTDIIVNDMQLLDRKEGGNKPPPEAYDSVPKPYEKEGDPEFFDDEILF